MEPGGEGVSRHACRCGSRPHRRQNASHAQAWVYRDAAQRARLERLQALCAIAQLAVTEYPAPERDDRENPWDELEAWDDELEAAL